MRVVKSLFLSASIFVGFAEKSFAQTGGGMQGGGGGQAGGNQGLGQQVDLAADFGGQTFTTVRNSGNIVSSSNALGSFYGNPFFSGKIGSSGMSPTNPTGGFGQALYSTGTSGGMTGTSGNFGGGTTGGRTGSTGSTGAAGGMTGFSSTGTTGGRTAGSSTAGGMTGFGGTTSGTGGFGAGATSAIGGGQMGMTGRSGMMGGMSGANAQSQYVVSGDRPIAALLSNGGSSGILPRTVQQMSSRAQIEIRTVYDRSSTLVSAKTIAVEVSENGVARLTGSVSNMDEKRLAAGLAQTTPGVRAVINELTVTNP